jgi:hypothetical protein
MVRKKLPAIRRQEVWNTHIGEYIGKILCPSCETNSITPFTFVCAHVLAVSNGGDNSVNNLRPICQLCNSSMYTQCMSDFIMEFYPTSPLMSTFDTKVSLSTDVVTCQPIEIDQSKKQRTVDNMVVQGKQPNITCEEIMSKCICPKCAKLFATKGSLTRHLKGYCIGFIQDQKDKIKELKDEINMLRDAVEKSKQIAEKSKQIAEKFNQFTERRHQMY